MREQRFVSARSTTKTGIAPTALAASIRRRASKPGFGPVDASSQVLLGSRAIFRTSRAFFFWPRRVYVRHALHAGVAWST